MRKKALAALLAAAMLAVTGCSGMPGMGTTNAPATKAGDEKAADAGSEANVGSNDTVYELKIHTSQTEQALITRNYQKLADTVNEKSDGRLSVKVFPAGQLGADEDVIEQAIQGVNVAVNTDAARMGQYVKDFSIFMMAYFVDNYDEGYAVTQTETFKNWEKELEEKEDIRHIQELIEQLPENQRQVIRLRGIEDCSYEDIEQITGLSSSNIRTLLSRARKLIREKLEKASCHG